MKYYKKNINKILILVGGVLILISILYILKSSFYKESFKAQCSKSRSIRQGKCLCPIGQKWTNGKCVCIEGTIFNTQCIKCPPNQAVNVHGVCEKCEDDQYFKNGQCYDCDKAASLDDPPCPCNDDQYLKNGKCFNCDDAEVRGDPQCL